MSNVIIIAEAGVNHNGNMDNAFQLIRAAKEAGADYVKFQTFKSENLVLKSAEKAHYQIENSPQDVETQFEMLQKLELSHEDHQKLISYCQDLGINFFSTAFDLESLFYLKDIGLDLVKIPSGEINNLPYLRLAAKLFSKVIISTGMCTMQEIKEAVAIFEKEGITKENITILHCNTEYPTPFEDVNLKAMLTIQNELKIPIGYSDHTLGIEVPIAAVALGAKMIEKHFTLSRSLKGPDHHASLEPQELKTMVSAIRNIEKAISGTGIKQPSASELKNIKVVRKSIVASKAIKTGDVFTFENITTKRPGNGISAMRWDEVIGQVAHRDYQPDDLIEMS